MNIVIKSVCLFVLISAGSAYVKNDKDKSFSVNSKIGEFLLHGLYSGGTGQGADFDLTHKMYNYINPYYINMLPENATNKSDSNNSEISQNSEKSVNFTTDDQSPTIYTYQPGGGYSISQSQDFSQNTDNVVSSSAPQNTYFTPDGPSNSYLPPSNSYLPPDSSYSKPMTSYGPPTNTYPPSTGYPLPTYGPPPPIYNPIPPPTPSYHHHHFHNHHDHHDVIYTPHKHSDNTLSWIWQKFTKKFDLLLISKILLKLIVFKKIIKFIAIICLLLFIPQIMKATVGQSDSDSDDNRNLDAYAQVDQKLKEIVNFAATAIEGFASDNIAFCVGEHEFYCRWQYALDIVDQRYDTYNKILTVWFPNLTTTSFPSTTSDLTYLYTDYTESPLTSELDADSVDPESDDDELEND